jgi:hypothetical protein
MAQVAAMSRQDARARGDRLRGERRPIADGDRREHEQQVPGYPDGHAVHGFSSGHPGYYEPAALSRKPRRLASGRLLRPGSPLDTLPQGASNGNAAGQEMHPRKGVP